MSLKLNFHQFAIFITKNGPLQAVISIEGYQRVFDNKKSLDGLAPLITDPLLTNSNNLKKNVKQHFTPDM